jgi:DNA-binding transcriptional regulator YdaS (Cro superfamily)
MNLLDLLRSMTAEDRAALADSGSTSVGHLRNIAYGFKSCAPWLAVSIERASGGAVTRRELRPGDWWLIWPEMITAEYPAPSHEQARATA